MKNTAALDTFAKKHIKPYDGMSITADVWTQAHDEHRLEKRAHNLNFHGSGIITGLEVVANDPPDQYVFISPGAAVDSAGNVIVLTEPVAYDFGNSAEGQLFLLLGHGEREVGGVQKEVKFLQYEFVIAARSSIPKRPSVELARVNLVDPDDPVKNAADPIHPAVGELDLRYRNLVGPEYKHFVNVALLYLGKDMPQVTSGWDLLSRECKKETPYQLILDPMLSISGGLADYDLVYIAAEKAFKHEANLVKELKNYLKVGKGLIVEAVGEEAQAACENLLGKIGKRVKPIKGGNEILIQPFLFADPPEGASGNQVLVAQQVIYSTAGYSLAWNGKIKRTLMARNDIRSVHEWGINLVSYCMVRP
jgi:hypothetical protein